LKVSLGFHPQRITQELQQTAPSANQSGQIGPIHLSKNLPTYNNYLKKIDSDLRTNKSSFGGKIAPWLNCSCFWWANLPSLSGQWPDQTMEILYHSSLNILTTRRTCITFEDVSFVIYNITIYIYRCISWWTLDISFISTMIIAFYG